MPVICNSPVLLEGFRERLAASLSVLHEDEQYPGALYKRKIARNMEVFLDSSQISEYGEEEVLQ